MGPGNGPLPDETKRTVPVPHGVVPVNVRKAWYVTIPDGCTTKWTSMTLVPVRLPVHACVPEPAMITFPSADLAVSAAPVGATLPATAVDGVAPDDAAATSATEATARAAI